MMIGLFDSRPFVVLAGLSLVVLAACGDSPAVQENGASTELSSETVHVQSAGQINPENWPKFEPVLAVDAEIEAKIADLLSRMTLEEKVGQTLQADISAVTPEDVRDYNLGAVLNGGNSAPGGDVRAAAAEWLALADAFWTASIDVSDGGVGIPTLWGTDAVHGHNNVVGATIFPHNIGLGAANNPELIHEIGRATATEMLTTGVDWTFAPTIAIARDDRWGRSYESYSENPDLVSRYAGEMVSGIQGALGSAGFLGNNRMIATVKHFVGDGGTIDGKDQGDNEFTEAQLRDLQAAGYPTAIQNGVQVVMASFNSFHGRKLHGHKELLTDVLVGRMGFDGFVVGDWNGHGQVEGCTSTSCAQSFNAGVDMFMAPDSWKELYANTLAQVRSGEITEERLDQAVSRILRVKLRTQLFEAGLPSSRDNAGDWNLLGGQEHRAIARQAVRESLVLIKNNNAVLPIQSGLSVLVTGDGADDIGKQSGGWTYTWQGRGNENVDFPNGESIFGGLRDAVERVGGTAELSLDGSYATKPDVAIVVFGEDPYAEFQGDVAHVDFGNDEGLRLLKQYQEEGIRTVSVFLSGRPMWVNPEINASDAFVAAWLPGSEGGGIADVLVARADGTPNHDFKGRLSFSWPRLAEGLAPNLGDDDYDPLFAFGYGLSYATSTDTGELPEDTGSSTGGLKSKLSLVETGSAVGNWIFALQDESGVQPVLDAVMQSRNGTLSSETADYEAQEDSIKFVWSGSGTLRLDSSIGPIDYATEAGSELGLNITYQVISAPQGQVSMGVSCGDACDSSLDMTADFASVAGQGWQTSNINLKCFEGADFGALTSAFYVRSEAGLELQIQSVELAQDVGSDKPCGL
ncbi:MAG: glycoside hydrolase family 3 N-terminal domain-containing protein [Hyphomonadaceae bacterium]